MLKNPYNDTIYWSEDNHIARNYLATRCFPALISTFIVFIKDLPFAPCYLICSLICQWRLYWWHQSLPPREPSTFKGLYILPLILLAKKTKGRIVTLYLNQWD